MSFNISVTTSSYRDIEGQRSHVIFTHFPGYDTEHQKTIAMKRGTRVFRKRGRHYRPQRPGHELRGQATHVCRVTRVATVTAT